MDVICSIKCATFLPEYLKRGDDSGGISQGGRLILKWTLAKEGITELLGVGSFGVPF
jgi:hypothetical protein